MQATDDGGGGDNNGKPQENLLVVVHCSYICGVDALLAGLLGMSTEQVCLM